MKRLISIKFGVKSDNSLQRVKVLGKLFTPKPRIFIYWAMFDARNRLVASRSDGPSGLYYYNFEEKPSIYFWNGIQIE